MSNKRPQFTEAQFYHIYNRGVEKRDIFTEKSDYFRMIHDLFELNDLDAAINLQYFFDPKSMEVEPRYIQTERKSRKILVKIHAFVLMPNHYHLLLEQILPGGIVKFMQKLGTAYTMYFNKKYTRVGPLYQGAFKAVHIKQDAHFTHIPFYIHANPLSLIYGGSTSIDTMTFLKEYRWSSFPDYVGIKNFPSITSRDLLLEYFGSEKEYEESTRKWLEEKERHENTIADLIIDRD